MNTNHYYSIGIDAHKHFCQIHVLNPYGQDTWKGRINNNELHRINEIVKPLDAPCRATFETSTNWHVLYDFLCNVKGIEKVIMAHPYKVKLICDAQLKNDKVDALKLAQLLRLDMIPVAHAAGPKARFLKELVRQRASWVGMRTKIRNRTHRLLGACPDYVELPKSSDVFGVKSLHAMKQLQLPQPYQFNLEQNMQALDELKIKISDLEKKLVLESKENKDMQYLLSIPGIGKVLAAVIAAEVDDIVRFPSKSKFISYCGIAPTTKGSAGNFYQGRMKTDCNKWLKWALIEAAWVAIGSNPYFGDRYKQYVARSKKPNTAITNIARRIAQIVYELLTQKRNYRVQNKPPNKFPARS